MTKPCTICQTPTAPYDFAKKDTTHYRRWCRACDVGKHNTRRAAKRTETLRKIGFESCMICNSGESLRIDHDHVTKAVRGLLCEDCNIGLGRFKDDPELMAKAIEYVRSGRNFGPHYRTDK